FLDLDLLFHSVMEKVLEIFDFDAARIYLFDSDKEELRLLAHQGFPKDVIPHRTYKPGQGILGTVFERGELILFEDIQNDPEFHRLAYKKIALRAGYRGSFGIPIKVKDKKVGMINFVSKSVHRFSPSEVQLITSMADQIGVAVENASLFGEVKRKSQELGALVEINKGIAALLDREVLLPRIAEEARRLLKMDGANFRLIEGEYLVLAGESRSEKLSFRSRLRLGESLSGKVVKENRIVAVRNVLEDPTIIDKHREIMRKGGYHSFLGIPLRVGSSIIGAINFTCKEEREFQPEEIQLITAFADQAAIAVQNANLFAEIKNKTTELEKTNQDLQEANRAKADFLASMSHELRTPLNVIVGNADLVRDGVFGDINEKQRDALEKVLYHSGNLLKLINDVLTLTRAEAKKMALNLSTFDVNEIVNHAQSYVEHLNRNGHLKILWKVEPNLPPMTTDALKLEEILQNLIGNAFKFTSEGRIEVRVRDLKKKGRIEFAVVDTGIGIDKRDLDRIFDQFHQLKEAHTGSYSGVGLGLNIVKKYLELMQGDIRVKSQPRIGSTFTFTLPYSI
ncbi:MAG: GAF domain-containing protein, partial [Candidatus Binatia bacterium]